MQRFFAVSSFAAVLLAPAVAAAQNPQGAGLFETHCMTCHRNPAPDSRAPTRDAMTQLTPERIFAALTSGVMAPQAQAAGLTEDQRRLIAEFAALRPFGTAGAGAASAMKNRCTTTAPIGDPSASPQWNGWSPDAGNARFQPAKDAGLTAEQVPKLKLKWAFAVPGATSMYGQPTVVSGHVFFGTDAGFVYSLDAATGCVHWSFEAPTGVRTAVVIAPVKGSAGVRHAAYFGDVKSNMYAVDADTGKLLWSRNVETHPLSRITGSIRLEGDRLFVPVSSWEETAGANVNYECCTFRGSVVALDAVTGKQLWKSYTIFEEPIPLRKNTIGTQLWSNSGGAVWNTPTVDVRRKAVFVGTGNAYTAPAPPTTDAVVAYDMETGKPLWWRQLLAKDAWVVGCRPNDRNRTQNCPDVKDQAISYNDADVGASPILRTLPDGRSILIVAGESGSVLGLDPARRGAIIWQTHLGEALPGQGQPGIGLGAGADDQTAYFPLERSTGGLTAINIATGERVWHTPGQKANCAEGVRGCSASQQGAVTVIPGVVFSGAADGTLRAYSTANGRILWEFNTAQTFQAVNALPAKGGSVRGPGVTVVGGTVYAGSGYGALGGMAGNVLLAFDVE
jgi:polyvinyl alcohol dehydrogenase (cytochrome)